MYFFTYKIKKDDLSWKLAVVGLVPENPREFEFKDTSGRSMGVNSLRNLLRWAGGSPYDFTRFTDEKATPGEPMKVQMRTELKKMLYSRRQSALRFYNGNNREYEMDTEPEY